MKEVLLIINPNSGKLKNKSMLFDIINTMTQNDCTVTVRITQRIGDATLYACEACNSDRYDIIVCSGGDGTLNEVTSGIASCEKKLPLGYIPSGSTNDYARSIGISSDIRTAARNAVCGELHTIDMGKINERYFNYIASFGAFTSVSYSAPQSLKKLLGHTAYVLEGIKDIAKIKSRHIRFECDDQIYDDNYIFGAVSNTTSIGGIVHIDESLVGLNDGLFEVCLVRKPRNPAELLQIISGALNSDFSGKCFEFFKTDTIKACFEEELPWSLDGEKHVTCGDVSIHIIKDAITLIN